MKDKTRQYRISIRFKLELLISMLVAVISLFIYLHFPNKFEKQAMKALAEHARSIGEISAFSIDSALFFLDSESAHQSLKALDTNSDITYAVVSDEFGELFVTNRNSVTSSFSFDPETPVEIKNNGAIYQLTTPIDHNGNTIGYLVLGFTLKDIRNSVDESKRTIALFSIFILAFGIASIMIISTIITTPLSNMVHTVRRIEQGDLKQRALINSRDEIQELAQTFNHMVDSLVASYEKLELFNKTLEERVKDRTRQLRLEIETRKKAEAELSRAKDYAERLVDLTPFAIYSVDTYEQITSWNRKAAEITGFDADEIIGNTCDVVMSEPCMHKCNLFSDEIEKPIEALVCTIKRKDGRQIIISKHADLLRDEHGDVIGGIECFEDITYRKRIEEELQIRQRMDSLGNLAGGIAHDFNNLLMGIMGNLDLIRLESAGLSTEQTEYVEESYQLSHRAAKLIREIQSLTFGTLTYRDNVDIYSVAHEVFGILDRTTDKLIEKQIGIEPERYFIHANEDQIHQVLLNLATNSVNAIQERGIRPGDYIRISAEDYTIDSRDGTGLPSGEYVRIVFSDNGIGMSESVRKRAFDPLFTTRQKSAKKGQGLGLAMVYTIITKNHKGHITIESAEGKGTAVHLWLAKGSGVRRHKPVEIEETHSGTGTILVVEDEEAIRELTRKALAVHNYKVITAFDGIDGLEQFHLNIDDINLVILDLTMPRMSGRMLYHHIRNVRKDMKIIISSGHSEDVLNEFGDIDGILVKPYEISTLLMTVSDVLNS